MQNTQKLMQITRELKKNMQKIKINQLTVEEI